MCSIGVKKNLKRILCCEKKLEEKKKLVFFLEGTATIFTSMAHTNQYFKKGADQHF